MAGAHRWAILLSLTSIHSNPHALHAQPAGVAVRDPCGPDKPGDPSKPRYRGICRSSASSEFIERITTEAEGVCLNDRHISMTLSERYITGSEAVRDDIIDGLLREVNAGKTKCQRDAAAIWLCSADGPGITDAQSARISKHLRETIQAENGSGNIDKLDMYVRALPSFDRSNEAISLIVASISNTRVTRMRPNLEVDGLLALSKMGPGALPHLYAWMDRNPEKAAMALAYSTDEGALRYILEQSKPGGRFRYASIHALYVTAHANYDKGSPKRELIERALRAAAADPDPRISSRAADELQLLKDGPTPRDSVSKPVTP